MNINLSQNRDFIIVTSDAIVGMDLVGIVSSAFPQSQTKVAHDLTDVIPEIAATNGEATVVVAASLIKHETASDLAAVADAGARIVVLEDRSGLRDELSSAKFISVPFTTSTVLEAIGAEAAG